MSRYAQAFFTSLDGGETLRAVIVRHIHEARHLAESGAQVGLDAMVFSFTDKQIADALIDAARASDRLRIRLIADWQQGGKDPAKQARRLIDASLPNILVRYTLDQPYSWDEDDSLARWSYAVSAGLFHHKTLLTSVNFEPRQMLLGSFNWTHKATRTAENLIRLDGHAAGARESVQAMQREFDSIWQDHSATLSPTEAEAWFERIVEALRVRGDPPDPPPFSRRRPGAAHLCEVDLNTPQAELAFSAPRDRCGEGPNAGHCLLNAGRSFGLRGSEGEIEMPLTLANLAKSVFKMARPGEEICVAAFALSRRAPEYNALLHAARRGVRIRVLLTRGRAADVRRYLTGCARNEGLQLEVRTSKRAMHQKYLLHRLSATVVTGTANFTPDAHTRHYESRLMLRGCETVCERFSEDYEALWDSAS